MILCSCYHSVYIFLRRRNTMTCPRCGKNLQPGAPYCTHCGVKFVSAPNAAAPASAPVARANRNYEKPSRITRFYRGCYKVFRLFPFIFFALYSLLFILFGVSLFLVKEHFAYLLLAIFGPVVSAILALLIALPFSASIVLTDAAVEIDKSLKRK